MPKTICYRIIELLFINKNAFKLFYDTTANAFSCCDKNHFVNYMLHKLFDEFTYIKRYAILPNFVTVKK